MNTEKLKILFDNGESCCGWYDDARKEVLRAADMLGVRPSWFAELTAVLSPRVAVSRNAKLAVAYAHSGELLSGVMKSTRLALHHWEATGEIRGPKTSAFAKAIDPDDPLADDEVVVDVWTWRAFHRIPFSDANIRRRSRIVSRIRNLAWEWGETPANTQARLWGGVRKEWGLKQSVAARLVFPIDWGVLSYELSS